MSTLGPKFYEEQTLNPKPLNPKTLNPRTLKRFGIPKGYAECIWPGDVENLVSRSSFGNSKPVQGMSIEEPFFRV